MVAASSGDDIPAQLAALLGKAAVYIRKTDETPPRISVIDAVAAITGRNAHRSAEIIRELGARYPEVNDNIVNLLFPGRGQRSTPVTDAKGIVDITMLLPGDHASCVRRQAAGLLCRYLGGDLAIIDEVCAFRELQERLADDQLDDPRRVFGETVEVSGMTLDRKRLLEDVEQTVRAVVQQEMKQHHVWSFSKRSRNHRELLEIGEVVQGSALRELDQAERVIQIAGFLKDRFTPLAWAQHGRKFKNIYTNELKRMKLRECREEGLPPPVTFNQGEHRIVYTEADSDLMSRVLQECRPRFEAIANRDVALFSRLRRGQRSIAEYMRPRAASESEGDGVSE